MTWEALMMLLLQALAHDTLESFSEDWLLLCAVNGHQGPLVILPESWMLSSVAKKTLTWHSMCHA